MRLEVTGVLGGLRIHEVLELQLLLAPAQLGGLERRLLLGSIVPDRVQPLRQARLHPVIGEMDVRVGGDEAFVGGNNGIHEQNLLACIESCGDAARDPLAARIILRAAAADRQLTYCRFRFTPEAADPPQMA